MTRAGGVTREAWPLFQGAGDGSRPIPALSAKSLHFFVCHHERARELNRLWHSRFPELGGGGSRVCYAAEAGGTFYAAAVWTNPTASALPQLSWLMLKRYAVADDAPRNAASRMLGWMTRDVEKRFPEVEWLVSYSDPDSHEGTIYRACGWIKDGESRRSGKQWHNRPRHHTVNPPCRRVVRWLYPMFLEFEPLEGNNDGRATDSPDVHEAGPAGAESHLRLPRRRAADVPQRFRAGRERAGDASP